MNFILGVIVGIILATVGLQGVVNIFQRAVPVVDSAVSTVKSTAIEQAKPVTTKPGANQSKQP